MVNPAIGDYIGWGRGATAGGGLLQWGGDNTGTGLESVAIDINMYKAAYPGQSVITVDFRCFWYGLVGTNPVRLNVTLYKGGALRKVGFGFDNPTAVQSKAVSSASKTVTWFSQAASTNGQGLARLTYNVNSGVGWFDTNLA